MTVAVSFNATPSGGQKSNAVVTASVTGLTATTAYILQVKPPAGGIASIQFTSDGSGNGSPTFVPNGQGTYNVVVVAAAQTNLATAALNVGGHT